MRAAEQGAWLDRKAPRSGAVFIDWSCPLYDGELTVDLWAGRGDPSDVDAPPVTGLDAVPCADWGKLAVMDEQDEETSLWLWGPEEYRRLSLVRNIAAEVRCAREVAR